MIDVGIYNGKLIITDERKTKAQIVCDDPEWLGTGRGEYGQAVDAIDQLIMDLQIVRAKATGEV